MEKISASECISAGWSLFKARPWFLMGVALVSTVAFAIPSVILDSASDATDGILSLIFQVGSAAVEYAWFISIIHFTLVAHENIEGATFRDAWAVRPFWKFVAASLLTSIVMAIGLVFLIVPGIILGLMLQFSGVIVVEHKLGPIEAMKESYRLTKGNLWRLFLLGLLLLLLNLAGLIIFAIGLLLTAPVSALALIHAYRLLEVRKSAPVAAAAVPV